MRNIHEILAGRSAKKPMSEARRQEIERQIATADEVREQRQAETQRNHWRKAIALFPEVRKFGVSISNPANVIQQTLAYHIGQGSDISMVGFWGEGGKPDVDYTDLQYMEQLTAMRTGIQKYYSPGARIEIILADLHGRFNGYYQAPKVAESESYLRQVQTRLDSLDIESVWLSELYRRWGIQLPDPQLPMDRSSQAYTIFSRHPHQYRRSATKHHKTEVDPDRAAYSYVVMRLNEREMLHRTFPHSILLVNGTKMTAEPLMPQTMPILYLSTGPTWFKRMSKTQR